MASTSSTAATSEDDTHPVLHIGVRVKEPSPELEAAIIAKMKEGKSATSEFQKVAPSIAVPFTDAERAQLAKAPFPLLVTGAFPVNKFSKLPFHAIVGAHTDGIVKYINGLGVVDTGAPETGLGFAMDHHALRNIPADDWFDAGYRWTYHLQVLVDIYSVVISTTLHKIKHLTEAIAPLPLIGGNILKFFAIALIGEAVEDKDKLPTFQYKANSPYMPEINPVGEHTLFDPNSLWADMSTLIVFNGSIRANGSFVQRIFSAGVPNPESVGAPFPLYIPY